MRLRHLARIAVLLSTVAVPCASAQDVTFSEMTDAVPSRLFDAALTAADPLNPNRLVIALNGGFDARAQKFSDFRASTAPFGYATAMDTIAFRVDAPFGFYVSRITYIQRGTGALLRTGRSAGGTNWVLAGYAVDAGTFGGNPSLSSTVDLTGMHLESVPVSITTSLSAFSTPALGSAVIAITGAEVLVEILPLPAVRTREKDTVRTP